MPFPSLGDLLDPGIKPKFPTLQADSLPSEPPGKPKEETATLNGRDATMTKGVQAETEQHLLGM